MFNINDPDHLKTKNDFDRQAHERAVAEFLAGGGRIETIDTESLKNEILSEFTYLGKATKAAPTPSSDDDWELIGKFLGEDIEDENHD